MTHFLTASPKKYLWMLALVSLLAAGCGKAPAGFSGRSGSLGQTMPPDCSVSTTTKKLRILLMVDNSGSTAATDPDQFYRVKTLRNFLATYASHANLSYGFGYFDDDAYLYDMNLGRFYLNSVATPIGGVTAAAGALDAYHASIPPSGNTAYMAAFAALQSAITRDENSGSTEDYSVVFMSDGRPTDIGGDVQAGISSLVASLKTAAQANGKSRLALSSVYFGSASDSTSIENLRSMSNQGGGNFVDTNHLPPGGLTIDDVVTIPGC